MGALSERNLIIHPGMPKSGSTAIQPGLKLASSDLQNEGVWYPTCVGGADNHSQLFSQSSVYQNPAMVNLDVEQCWASLRSNSLKLEAHTTILSSEVIFARLNEEAFLEGLREYFRGWDNLKIVSVFRHQIEFVEAAYCECLRSVDWRHVLPLEALVPQVRSSLVQMAAGSRVADIRVNPQYYDQIAAYQDAFPDAKIAVLDYGAVQASSQSIVVQFLEAAGVTTPRFAEDRIVTSVKNVSISPIGMNIAQMLGMKLTPEIEIVLESEIQSHYEDAEFSTIYSKSEFWELKSHFDALNGKAYENSKGIVPKRLKSKYDLIPPKMFRDDLTQNDWRSLLLNVRRRLQEANLMTA